MIRRTLPAALALNFGRSSIQMAVIWSPEPNICHHGSLKFLVRQNETCIWTSAVETLADPWTTCLTGLHF
ncbi:hypothetical protein OPQ81_003622 [Rhizoctonia solani]|nr:hypothetical protein OPQ81_003622 [Rhizoctonia solani]